MPPSYRRGNIPAVTPAVQRTFDGALTAEQRQAIDLAVNTPDIVVIQGPPGTGKTKVITAIQARLAEALQSERPVSQVGHFSPAINTRPSTTRREVARVRFASGSLRRTTRGSFQGGGSHRTLGAAGARTRAGEARRVAGAKNARALSSRSRTASHHMRRVGRGRPNLTHPARRSLLLSPRTLSRRTSTKGCETFIAGRSMRARRPRTSSASSCVKPFVACVLRPRRSTTGLRKPPAADQASRPTPDGGRTCPSAACGRSAVLPVPGSRSPGAASRHVTRPPGSCRCSR